MCTTCGLNIFKNTPEAPRATLIIIRKIIVTSELIMSETEEYNCVYCEKTYKRRGWLAGHIMKKHEDCNLLDKDMTVLRDNANDISTKEACLDLSDNTNWNEPEYTNLSGPTSTPKAPTIVPLCQTANKYVIEKAKTLPASFLATLLPSPGFLEEINRSLQQQDPVDVLMERFEKEIQVFKCNICESTCTRSQNLKNHMSTKHLQAFKPTSPDPALPSLGDYLASLETKIDQCTDYIIKQSVIASKQSVMIEKLLAHNEQKSTETDVIQFFKCDLCRFETEDRPIFNSHKNQAHKDTHS